LLNKGLKQLDYFIYPAAALSVFAIQSLQAKKSSSLISLKSETAFGSLTLVSVFGTQVRVAQDCDLFLYCSSISNVGSFCAAYS
jgi:hypothetical protein